MEIPDILTPNILIIATMDTKGSEALYLRDILKGLQADTSPHGSLHEIRGPGRKTPGFLPL